MTDPFIRPHIHSPTHRRPTRRSRPRPQPLPTRRCRRSDRRRRRGRGRRAPKGPSFAELGLHADVLRAIEEMGFTDPMPVQSATLPLIRDGRDLMVQSRTGSGKTAAFGIPFANGIVNGDDKFVQAIVLLPTRELALQVAAELAKICQYRQMTVVPVYGGAPMGRQVEQLRAGGQIVCGTPGRVLDHLRRGTLQLDRVRCAVLDECDEMLSMGFQEDIESILEKTPTARQTLLFSATVPEGIQRLARRFLRSPEFLKLSGDYVSVHDIRHVYYSIPGIQREEELLRILDFEEPKSAIIFCNTREETGRVAAFLRGKGHDAEAISSDLSQSDRERVLGRMRAGRHQVPGRDRRRGARHRHREPVARVQLHVPRGARDLHPPHRPHRPRRPQGDRDLADRPHRGRVVLLPEAALQDQTRGALAAVGGGDPIAPRGRARARCCGGRSTGDPGARVARARAPAGERGRR